MCKAQLSISKLCSGISTRWRKKKYFFVFLDIKNKCTIETPTHTEKKKRNKREKYVNSSNGERYLLGTGRGSLNKIKKTPAGRVLLAESQVVCVWIFLVVNSLRLFFSSFLNFFFLLLYKRDGRAAYHWKRSC